MSAIVPIVEGQSEVESIRNLILRILVELGRNDITVARPFRVKRNRVVKEGELERAVQQAVRDRENACAILVLLDADDDNPDALTSALTARARGATTHPVGVVIANRELEAWFLGAKESLRGHRGIHADAVAPPNPEAIRGAKGALSRNMEGRRYLEIDDQPSFAALFNMKLAAERCKSFGAFQQTVKSLANAIKA